MTVSDGVRATSMGQFSRETNGSAGGGIARDTRPPVDAAAEHQEWLDRQPATVGCLHCPEFTFTGPAIEARAAAAAHRQQLHPELVGKHTRRKPAAGGMKRVKSEAEIAQIEAAKRARAEQEAAEREERLEQTRRRLVGLEETSLDLSQTAGSPTDDGGVSSSPSPNLEEETMAKIGPAEQACLDAMRAGASTAEEVAAARGVTASVARQNLGSLFRKGVIGRVGRGRYAVPGSTSTVAPPAPAEEPEPVAEEPKAELEPVARVAPPRSRIAARPAALATEHRRPRARRRRARAAPLARRRRARAHHRSHQHESRVNELLPHVARQPVAQLRDRRRRLRQPDLVHPRVHRLGVVKPVGEDLREDDLLVVRQQDGAPSPVTLERVDERPRVLTVLTASEDLVPVVPRDLEGLVPGRDADDVDLPADAAESTPPVAPPSRAHELAPARERAAT